MVRLKGKYWKQKSYKLFFAVISKRKIKKKFCSLESNLGKKVKISKLSLHAMWFTFKTFVRKTILFSILNVKKVFLCGGTSHANETGDSHFYFYTSTNSIFRMKWAQQWTRECRLDSWLVVLINNWMFNTMTRDNVYRGIIDHKMLLAFSSHGSKIAQVKN